MGGIFRWLVGRNIYIIEWCFRTSVRNSLHVYCPALAKSSASFTGTVLPIWCKIVIYGLHIISYMDLLEQRCHSKAEALDIEKLIMNI
jgi:hypothetical protein